MIYNTWFTSYTFGISFVNQTTVVKNLYFDKTMKKNQHIVPNGDKWAVKGAGNGKATKIVDTQREAIERAREIAINQQSEVVIHRPDGRIRDKDSYGNDPNPPRDKKF